ncbi:MAG: TIGR01777 family oxidoreductase [Bdellovibrionales bacterium]
MKVLITGATGTIGHEICIQLLRRGHELTIVTRKSEEQLRSHWNLPVQILTWEDPAREPMPSEKLSDIEAVIHLAGESINQRWSDSAKQRILDSREQFTKKLVDGIHQHAPHVKTFVSASAIGIYPNAESTPQNEDSTIDSSDEFLPTVCRKWENASHNLKPSIRKCIVRIGVVLDQGQGFLGQLEPLYQKAIAGPIGSGNRYLSWIHIDDLVGLFIAALENDKYNGVLNGTAPQPVTNQEFNSEFAKVNRVPNVIPVPPFALKILFGEMSSLALSDQFIIPEKSKNLGFQFKYPTLEKALGHLYAWKTHYLDRRMFQWQWIPHEIANPRLIFLRTQEILKK